MSELPSERSSGRPDRRRSAPIVAALPAAILALYALGVAVWPLAAGIDPTVDDGYYYYEIAHRLAAGDGSTFDGLHPTNGYHPLWLLTLAALFRAVTAPASAVLAAGLVQAVLAAGAAALAYRASRRGLGRLGAVLATLIFVDLGYRFWLGGLELALHAFLLLLTIRVDLAARAGRGPPRAAAGLALGIYCALAFLARVDTILLAPLLAIAWLLRGGWRPLAAFVAPVAVTAGVYAAVNLSVFGHLGPVSAAVKRGWSEALLAADPVYAAGDGWGWLAAKALHLARPFADARHAGEVRGLALGVAAAIFFAVLTLAAHRARFGTGVTRPRDRPAFLRRPALLAPWAAYALLQFLVYGLWYHGSQSYRPWYFVVQPWLGAVLVAAVVELALASAKSRPRMRRWLVAGAVALCFVVAVHTVRGVAIWQRSAVPSPFRHAAAWIDATLPPDARVGAWNAGTLGYWSARTVINLDGLVNSWDFYARGRFDLCRYWRDAGITHVVDAYRDGQFLTLMPTLPSYRHCADRLELIMRDEHDEQDGGPWSIRAYRLRP